MRGSRIFMAGAITVFLATAAFAMEASPLFKSAKEVFAPLPDAPVFKKDNPANEAKLKLGKMLYFDNRLSKSNALSCNSCHNLATGGVDQNPVSIGHKWEVGGRNSPTVLNASLQVSQFWDGRAADVEAQAQGPILNPIEMSATQELVMARIKSIPEYVEIFKQAFPEEKDAVTYKNLASAIGAFERTLITPSKFDTYLKGDEKALSKSEQDGLKLFMDKGCASCHNGVLLGGDNFQKFGVHNKPDFLKDRGRFEVTKKEEDMNVFKIPTLRNIAITYPYFNDGSVWELNEAVKTMAWAQLGEKMPDGDAEKIVTFLNTLTGKLPEITIPVLPASTAATPKPDRN